MTETIAAVQFDLQPLEGIFKKSLLAATKRLQRMLLHLLMCNLRVMEAKASELFITDILFRAFRTDYTYDYIFSTFAKNISQNDQSERILKNQPIKIPADQGIDHL